MTFGTYRAAGHQPAVLNAADPRILDAIALEIMLRCDHAVVMDMDDLEAVGRQFDRQQPRQRGQRHHAPLAAAPQELARVGCVAAVQRPSLEPTALTAPADATRRKTP